MTTILPAFLPPRPLPTIISPPSPHRFLCVYRPTLDDVSRLSTGKSTRSRAGSRSVPHRLNRTEHTTFSLAQRNGYLTLPRNLGFRRERKGSPLLNIFRQWCDATERAAILYVKADSDEILVDVSSLRLEQEGMFEDVRRKVEQIVGKEMKLEGEWCGEEMLEEPIWKVGEWMMKVEVERDEGKEVVKKLAELWGGGEKEKKKRRKGKRVLEEEYEEWER